MIWAASSRDGLEGHRSSCQASCEAASHFNAGLGETGALAPAWGLFVAAPHDVEPGENLARRIERIPCILIRYAFAAVHNIIAEVVQLDKRIPQRAVISL